MVEWTDEAREAVFKAFHEWWNNSRMESADLAPCLLNAITLHVEAMVREARAEALESAAEVFATGEWSDAFTIGNVTDDVSAVQATETWLRARAEEVRRGE